MLNKVAHKISNMIKRACSSAPMQDAGNFPVIQVKYHGRPAIVEVLLPYGLCSSPPVGSLATMFNVMGQEENRTAILDYPQKRFKNLSPGEVAVGNYVTAARLYFKADGNVELHVPGDYTIHCAGNLLANVGGEVTFNTSRVNMTGDLEVVGDITDQRDSNTNSVGDMRDIYNSHEHPENDSGGPTDQPNEQM